MRVGLIGAQGVGKTTLTEAVSNETDLPLIFTQSAKVFEEMGIRPDKRLPFNLRMVVQQRILDSAEELWREHSQFITDRTPLDMLAYTMVDFNSSMRLTEEEALQFRLYRDSCIKATNRYFTTLVVVQPGIPFVKEQKPRAALDKALIEKMNTMMLGLVASEDVLVYKSHIPRSTLSLSDRVKCVEYSIQRSAQRYTQGLAQSAIH